MYTEVEFKAEPHVNTLTQYVMDSQEIATKYVIDKCLIWYSKYLLKLTVRITQRDDKNCSAKMISKV